MKVGIIGSGGREHALCEALKKSSKISEIYCIPGNAGTNSIAENIDLNISDFEKLKNFGHHDEFDESGIDVEFIKSKIKNKEVFYDHFADKTNSEKWKASYKLRKIDSALLPKYLRNNTEKFKDWFDN